MTVDEFILSVTGPKWCKVARVIGDAFNATTLDVSEDDDVMEVVEARIRALINSGALESQGDVTSWRASEIRRSPAG